MPPKMKTPAPIDRPLSRAYLREFTGWSSAYPPGLSDPTSLRIMENVMIQRDGSCRIRPGLRYLSVQDQDPGLFAIDRPIVGTHEPFFLNSGTKAYLFAVRETDQSVGFRVLAESPVGMVVQALTAPGVDFTIIGGAANLAFTAATTYVKYLQIDNKIFALSNAGETMRIFRVGSTKTAKALASIERPDWTPDDKLVVVHPDAGWTSGSVPLSTRKNYFASSSMEAINAWKVVGADTKVSRSGTLFRDGPNSMRLESLPERTNLCPKPLHNVASTGIGGWTAFGANTLSVQASGSNLRINLPAALNAGSADRRAYVQGPTVPVVPGKEYQVAWDLMSSTGATRYGVRFRFYNTAGAPVADGVDRINSGGAGRKDTSGVLAPSGSATMRYYLWAEFPGSGPAENWQVRNIVVGINSEGATMFTGSSGVNYYWTGAINDSASVYHPPKDLVVRAFVNPITVATWIASVYFQSMSTGRTVNATIDWYDSSGFAPIGTVVGATGTDTNGSWLRRTATGAAPATTVQASVTLKVLAAPRGEYHYVDSALFEAGGTAGTYFDGSTTDTTTVKHKWVGTAHDSASTEQTFAAPGTLPTAETKTANTLISSTAADNEFNFGFFYTFNNEVGESAASQVTVVRAQRSWQSWRWETPNGAGEPSGTPTTDPEVAADQLVAYVPLAAYSAAIDQGATHWTLYAFTWSDQDPVPVSAVRIGQREISPATSHGAVGWLRMTPQLADAGDETTILPKLSSRYNYSNPSRGGQGIVASDRMVLVNDPVSQGVIRWTSNLQGSYTDFTAVRGGGYKTLTSGNLYVPACVKLWQNPQSADTLTILCLGVDGQSTGYYMAPAAISSQSETTNVMGFEETTATPGTTSPYGVEVLNNALYHPLDELIMKSTATNYNINHKAITDLIQDTWRKVQFKHHVVSSQYDNRLYYLVYNPAGAALEDGCWGNEVWVFDAQSEGGSWSRWLVQGHSLRKIDRGGTVAMSVVRPDGIFYFDENYASDDYVMPDRTIATRAIPWKLETNTQGANRAHDAFAHLQQANIVVGNFQGVMRYGIRSWDIHGKPVDISKLTRDGNPVSDLQFDLEDFLQIRRDLKEWFFYAESVEEDGVVQPSAGQINLVQYRYTPVSVNVGYEFGSIETFEYQRAGQPIGARTTDNGVPMPYVDTGRP